MPKNISQTFGNLQKGSRYPHNGIDYVSALGNPIKSVAPAGLIGAFTKANASRFGSINPDGLGPVVWVQYTLASGDPIYVIYGHTASSWTDTSERMGTSAFDFRCTYAVSWKRGDAVELGDEIGKTAPFYRGTQPKPHLHISVFKPNRSCKGGTELCPPPSNGWGYSPLKLATGDYIDPELFFTDARYALKGYPPTTGTIAIRGTLDGSAWSGNVTYLLSGPSGFSSTQSTLGTVSGLAFGLYTLESVTGGPPTAYLDSIDPCGVQLRGPTPCTPATPLSSTNASQVFTLKYKSNAPTAGFILTSGAMSVTEGQKLEAFAPLLDSATIGFDATRSRGYNANAITRWRWTVTNPDGSKAVIGTTKVFSAYFPVGTYAISLVVADGRGVESTPAEATIAVSANAPASENWSEHVASTSPTAIDDTRPMVYDAARGEVVFFPPYNGPALSNQTWIWNGATWLARTPAQSPPKRGQTAMAYDELHSQAVLFGGFDNNAKFLNDTWVWDGSTWTEKFPLHRPPPMADQHAMTYDRARGAIVLVRCAYSGCDTWTWDGVDWQLRHSMSGHMERPVLAFDAVHQEVVMFIDGTAQTWIWNGATWAQRFPANSPPARSYPSMVFDSVRGKTVLFGGVAAVPPYPFTCWLNDTWEWDGQTWVKQQPIDAPPARSNAGMAYDEARGQIVLFGGNGTWSTLTDTWTWDRSPSRTSVLFTSFGDAMSFNQLDSKRFGSSDGEATGVATRFTPNQDGRLSQLSVAISRMPDRSVLIQLLSDVDGQPGDVIENFVVEGPFQDGVASVSSIQKPALIRGRTYWLALRPGAIAVFGYPSSAGLWFSTPRGLTEVGATMHYSNDVFGPWMLFPTTSQPAFEIRGVAP